MKIRVLRNLGRSLPQYTEGQVVEADDDVAVSLVAKGLAVQLEQKKPVKAVPSEPVKAKPAETAKAVTETPKAKK